MKKIIVAILGVIGVYTLSHAQIGGESSFEFLHVPENARAAALGGVNNVIYDRDVNLVQYNPAALNPEMYEHASVNFLPYYSDVSKSSVAYAHDFSKIGGLAFGVQYMGYGDFTETQLNGTVIGEFKAREYALTVSKSHRLSNFSIGATAKFVGSSLAEYSASALLLDVGGMFIHPEEDLTIGLTFKNVGVAVGKYTPSSDMTVPFDVQFGAAYKLEHMPLRILVNTHHLHRGDVQYLDPSRDTEFDEDGNEVPKEEKLTEQVFRRFVFGTEFVFSDNFHIRAGYNVMRRKELRQELVSGGAGFSIGTMIRVKTFEFNYTRAFYHVAGGTSMLTLTVDTATLFKKKKSDISEEDILKPSYQDNE
jgi:hypothetical protein